MFKHKSKSPSEQVHELGKDMKIRKVKQGERKKTRKREHRKKVRRDREREREREREKCEILIGWETL
jgi:hypothetical protein